MFFRMNIRRSKTYIWLLNIAAILCITLTFALIYKKKNEGVFKPRKGEVILKALERGMNTKRTERGAESLNINNYSAIWKAPISGEKPKDAANDLDLEKVEAPEEGDISEILSVMWTARSDDPKESRVRLSYLQDEEEAELTFKLAILSVEGDSLKPPYDGAPYFGKVLKIEDDWVTFSYKGEEVRLSPAFAGEEDNERMRGGRDSRFPSGVVRSSGPPPAETREIEPGHWQLSLEERDNLRKDWERELELVTIAAVKNPKTGKTDLQITALKPNSLAAKRGFMTGDTLISINGFPISSKAGAINYVKEHPDQSQYVVVISRMGKYITKTFTAPKD